MDSVIKQLFLFNFRIFESFEVKVSRSRLRGTKPETSFDFGLIDVSVDQIEVGQKLCLKSCFQPGFTDHNKTIQIFLWVWTNHICKAKASLHFNNGKVVIDWLPAIYGLWTVLWCHRGTIVVFWSTGHWCILRRKLGLTVWKTSWQIQSALKRECCNKKCELKELKKV